jgi:hypothetical protein
MDMHSHNRHDGNGGAGNVGRWVFWGFALIAGYFLFTEHRAHLFSILPYLLLLACPLMHLFHHHGHRYGGRQTGEVPPERGDTNASSNAPSHPDQ